MPPDAERSASIIDANVILAEAIFFETVEEAAAELVVIFAAKARPKARRVPRSLDPLPNRL
jgi:hypothetical protein